MEDFDDWCHRISKAKNDVAAQAEVADKILELLKQKKDSVGESEQILFAQAITVLFINVNSAEQSTKAGLDGCIVALRKAMDSETEPDESQARSDFVSVLLGYGMLVATVEKIKEQIRQKSY